MKFTRFGHAAYLIEDGSNSYLIDPGNMSDGLEKINNLTAILYTHSHGDHYDDTNRQVLVKNNPDVMIVADETTAAALKELGQEVTEAHDGDELDLNGLKVKVVGSKHAEIHPSMDTGKNVGYFINEKVFYPGDALTLPEQPVEVLLIPVSGPWLKMGESMEYLIQVKPKYALPTHDALSAVPGMEHGALDRTAQANEVEFRPLSPGQSTEI